LLKDEIVMATLQARHREYMPTPEEISRRAAAVRKGWSAEVRASRRKLARVYQQVLLSGSNRSAA
jgi:hypothetical protein